MSTGTRSPAANADRRTKASAREPGTSRGSALAVAAGTGLVLLPVTGSLVLERSLEEPIPLMFATSVAAIGICAVAGAVTVMLAPPKWHWHALAVFLSAGLVFIAVWGWMFLETQGVIRAAGGSVAPAELARPIKVVQAMHVGLPLGSWIGLALSLAVGGWVGHRLASRTRRTGGAAG